MTPNYELLKDAYAIIDGIPEEYFDLSEVVFEDNLQEIGCGTIACAAGWLGLHPKFQALGYVVSFTRWGYEVTMSGLEHHSIYSKVGTLFGLSDRDAMNLFEKRGHSRFDSSSEVAEKMSDKELWKKRVELFLAQEGQL